jgi:hypothetical protein
MATSIRTATRVNSETGGLFFIRRERNLTRWYVQLNKGKENEDLPLELITKDIIVGEIQRMLDPFTVWTNTRNLRLQIFC